MPVGVWMRAGEEEEVCGWDVCVSVGLWCVVVYVRVMGLSRLNQDEGDTL